MEQDLVSVIVPMYNCENYIEHLIKTILSQTYKNIELILVDDGSSDNTLKICRQYQKDNRVKIITQKNGGVSKARNCGLDKATGKYIFFADADDYIELNAIEDMTNIYKEKKVELVTTGFYSEVLDKEKVKLSDKIFAPTKLYKNKSDIKEDFVILWDKHILYNVWNKLYLRNIITKFDIKFPEYNWGEDIQFNREYLYRIKSMYNSEKCYYHYIRERKNSATEKFIDNLYEIRVKEYYEFIDYFNKMGINNEDYEEFVARRHIERTLGCIENIEKKDNGLKFIEKYKEVKRIINDGLTKKCLKEAKIKSKKVKIMLVPYRLHLIIITMTMGKVLTIFKNNLPQLFNWLKNRR